MRSDIKDLNALMGNARLSTNPETAATSNIMGIGTVLEKKLTLLEKKGVLEQKQINEPLTGKEEKELKKINKDLQKAPSKEQIAALADKTLEEMNNPSKALLNGKDAKALNEVPPELKWGNSHMAVALTTPANWTPMHTATIKESKAGSMHVCVEILEPMNIGDKGGVSSGLRNKAPYDIRVTNFIKTTSYIKQEDGSQARNQISYRGGQFPTKEAAKEAISEIIKDNNGVVPEDLHINTLLTPTTNPILKLFRKDSKLLPEHKQNIEEALNELIQEAKGNPEREQALINLKERTAISNFGVNQDAMGEIQCKPLGIGSLFRLKFGWHTSIRDYSNNAAKKLNSSFSRKLDSIDSNLKKGKLTTPDKSASKSEKAAHKSTLKDLDRLGALFTVGLEMEAAWATNDYAEGRGSNNQFKLPALWKTMDGLLDVITYSDCMSGKDRTGWVESNAKEFFDEIEMNIIDQKHALLISFEDLSNSLDKESKRVWQAHKDVLTTACFTPEELKILANNFKEGGDFPAALSEMLKTKLDTVKRLNENGGLMRPKEGMHGKSVGRFSYSTSGIPKTIPKANSLKEEGKQFPQLTVSSMYGREAINYLEPDDTQIAVLQNRQREAVNRRMSQLGGSLQVIQKNTSKAGNKENKGEPLARFASGFDRDYVLYKLFSEDPVSNFSQWTGLHELDTTSAQHFEEEASRIQGDTRLNKKKKIKAYTSLLKDIEKAKMQGLSAQGKVKA
jgi:hypothetical protein